jgi:glycosyltransferase involved in cell wall biosynthesis
MRRRCPVEVISPVPFVPPLRAVPAWYTQSRIPARERIDEIDVSHPRFVVLPKLEAASGLGYALGVLAPLHRLKAEAPDLVVHAHCAFPDGVGVALAAQGLGLPYAVTAHGSDINVYAPRAALGWQIRRALAGAAAVLAVSRDLQGKIEQMLGPGARPVHHVPCAGFDPALFRPRDRCALRAELGTPADGRLILFVGQLVPIKRIDRLIEAWRLLHAEGRLAPADRVVVIGDGPERATLAGQAAASGIADRVTFAGPLPQPTVARWIGAADLLCLPSDSEGTPNVIVEALASGVPVVASRVGGVPELVTPESNGLLVPPGDASGLARALGTALERAWDVERIRASVANFNWDRLGDRTIDCLSGAVGGRHAAVA